MIFFKKKRAAIGMQFNWIFVLIAGGIFLIMITSIIMTQQSASNQEISAKLIQKLNSYFKIEQESNVFREIKTYQTVIDFRCTEEGVSDYRVSGITQQTPVEPIFAPGALSGQTIYLWTMDWKAPFKIMSFSFVSNPKTVFYFYNDSQNEDMVRKVINEFPKNLSRNMSYKVGKNPDNPDVDLGETNYDNYKVIYLNHDVTDTEYPYVEITIENDMDGYGEIFFEEESYFLGKASLYGAIFSEDKESYECNMEKAFKRYKILSNLMLSRTNELKAGYSYSSCADNYYNAVVNLKTINKTTSLGFNELTEESIEELYKAVNSLERANDYLALRGCPVLY